MDIGMRWPAWRAAAAGLLLAGAAFLLPGAGAVRDGVYLTVAWAAVAAIAVGTRVHRPERSVAWVCLGGGLAATAVGETLFFGGRDHLLPAVGDATSSACYAAGLLGVGGAMVGFASSRRTTRPGGTVRDGLLESTALAVAVALLVWTFLIEASTRAPGPALGARLLALLYVTAAIVLVVVFLRLFVGQRGRGTAYGLLAAAAAVGLAASVTGPVLDLSATHPDPTVDTAWDVAANLGLLCAFGLVATAALHPSMRRLTVPPPEEPAGALTRWRLLLLAAATLTTPVVLLGQQLLGTPVDPWAVGLGSAAVTVLVLVRLAGLVRQVQAQARQLAELADTDPLTALPNRRAWVRRVDSDLARAVRDSTTMAVALMDLDHFKAYNDAHGHPAGDAALRLAAAGWRGRLRAGDLLARLGGEEFAVLLPGASPEDAYAALEDLRRATPPGLTVSIGFAGHVPGDTGESLLARADAALYAAKRAGRDRVHASPEAVTSAPRAARLGVAAATTSQL